MMTMEEIENLNNFLPLHNYCGVRNDSPNKQEN